MRPVVEAGSDAATTGELLVRGPQVFAEYWRRPEATAEAFVDGWFRTGDVAVRDPDGYRLLGRSSVDISKTGGEKVSALEIEELYRTHPDVADCAVVGVPDDEWGERVCAAVVLTPGADGDRRRCASGERNGGRRPRCPPTSSSSTTSPATPSEGPQTRCQGSLPRTLMVRNMTVFTQIRYEVEGPAAVITLDRPDHLNAFTGTMLSEMVEAFDRADADDAVRAVIVTGAGRAFCAGADLSSGGETFDLEARGVTPANGRLATAAASSCCGSSRAPSR